MVIFPVFMNSSERLFFKFLNIQIQKAPSFNIIIKQMTTSASLQTPSSQNLYELPDCSICLVQLCKDIAVLPCGHCYHYACIMQAFQKKETCPICQKKSTQKQLRVLHYQTALKSKAKQTNSVFQNLTLPQRNQIEFLFKLFKDQSQQLEKLKGLKASLESEVEIQKKYIQNVKSINDEQRQDITRLRKLNLRLLIEQKDFQSIMSQCFQYKNYCIRRIYDLERELEDYEMLKKYQKVMSSNEQLCKLKSQMENNNVPPSVMAKQFYSLCQMASFEAHKNMHIIQDYKQRVQYYGVQFAKLKQYNQRLEEQIKGLSKKMQSENKQQQQEHKQNEAQKNNNKYAQKPINNKTKKTKAPRKKDSILVNQYIPK